MEQFILIAMLTVRAPGEVLGRTFQSNYPMASWEACEESRNFMLAYPPGRYPDGTVVTTTSAECFAAMELETN